MEGELKVRNNVLEEETYRKTIKEGTETFKITALSPADQQTIARTMAVFQNGNSWNTYSPEDQFRFNRDATVEVGVIEGPDWWEGVLKCPDEDLLTRLYKAIEDFSGEIQEKLKKNKLVKRGAKAGTSN